VTALRALWAAPFALAMSCVQPSPVPEGSWEVFPDELVFATKVGTRDVKEFRLVNNSEAYIEIEISRPISDGNCPEEPFTPPPAMTRIAPNSSQTIRVEHGPDVVPASGTCIFRLQLTRQGDDETNKATIRLDGGVIDADEDGDGVGRGEGDCNDRPPEVDPNSPFINPDVQERCNGIDDDCDGLIDDDDNNEDLKWIRLELPAPAPLVAGQAPYLPDADGDTWPRDVPVQLYCLPPLGFVDPPSTLTTANNAGYDCNDQVFEIFPGASELSGEGVDRNCDGLVTCYTDLDLDGFGDDSPGTQIAHDPNDPYCQNGGVARISGDCDDSRGDVSPSASEVCDPLGADEDCDRLVNDNDPGVAQETQDVWFYDGDGDGFGTSAIIDLQCTQPAGYVTNAQDCNDTNDAIFPASLAAGGALVAGGVERCNGIDEDCDGVPDDGAIDPTTWYADRDNDGFGVTTAVLPSDTTQACTQPLGYVNNADDCNDANGTVNNYALDVPADGLDSNCDGFELCYRDRDDDNFGVPETGDVPAAVAFGAASGVVCDVAGFTNNSADCLDNEPLAYPGRPEDCDGIDNDCDNRRDDDDADVNASTPYYRDQDADSFGDPGFPRLACSVPVGFVPNANDCDDTNPAVNPAAIEFVADGIDETCDGIELCYVDADGDDYGTPGLTAASAIGDVQCATFGLSLSDDDCNDALASVNPGAVELCDAANVDENCNSRADDLDRDPVGTRPWFVDDDADLFGATSSSVLRCDQPAGFVQVAGDCNDANDTINPNGTEICNGTDDDCDGSTDDGDATLDPNGGFTPARLWYQDLDGDGRGNDAISERRCEAPLGTTSIGGDCNDTNPDVRPGALEGVADGLDQNCDGLEDCYTDADNDDWGTSARTTRPSGANACAGAGVATINGDCDDTRATVAPDKPEICDTVDNDCDRLSDDFDDDVQPGTSDAVKWLRDRDADTYGDPGDVRYACQAPPGYIAFAPGGVPRATDCDDGSTLVFPTATEVTADGIDQDCDRADTCWRDTDGDRYGVNTRAAGTSPSLTCSEIGLAANNRDCDDTSPLINPAAVETCDPGDEDCDGFSNDQDGSVLGGTTWFFDNDGDGEGNPNITTTKCAAPARFVATATDCNDNNATVRLGGTEICDVLNVDEDCDGVADDADPNVAAAGKRSFYTDADFDGYGDLASAATLACDPQSNQSRTRDDCDDNNPAVRPGATETAADSTDANCDGFELCYCNRDGDSIGSGTVVESSNIACQPPASPPGSPAAACADGMTNVAAITGDCDDTNAATGLDLTPYFLDADVDGYGNPNVVVVACQPPPGTWVTNPSDCADNSATIRPGGTELCDSLDRDEDCDGLSDDADTIGASPSGKTTWYLDNDLDGYGASASTRQACDGLFNETTNSADCDDNDPARKPGANETAADNVDQNCDGRERCYVDADNDNLGISAFVDSPLNQLNCVTAPNAAALPGDCDDTNASVGSSQTLWYVDADNDTYGNSSAFVLACNQPGATGWTTQGGDCADNDAARKPSATEVCDAANLDEDCDGLADNSDTSATGKTSFFIDVDGDGYGTASTQLLCDVTTGFATVSGDCADANPSRNPLATEVLANGVDENCDGNDLCYCNRDGDSFGSSTSFIAAPSCTPPASPPVGPAPTCTTTTVSDRGGDCNDADKNVLASAALWFFDQDNDSYGTASVSQLACDKPSAPLGSDWETVAGDCVDTESAINPAATETCNLTDDDCDSVVDNAAGAPSWFPDVDSDGYGASAGSLAACVQPSGYVSSNTDCNDGQPTMYPSAPELCDGLNNDCVSATPIDASAVDAPFWAPDADLDGWGTSTYVRQCSQPAAHVAAGAATDCNDADRTINPGVLETCDATDRNCDGNATLGAIDTLAWIPDTDGDGFGRGTVVIACSAPANTILAGGATDCDDTTRARFPGNQEICDTLDNDCDNTADDGAIDAQLVGDDDDGDGYPSTPLSRVCTLTGNQLPVTSGLDCDDTSIQTNPGRPEVCNAVDDDCTGLIDDGATCPGFEVFFVASTNSTYLYPSADEKWVDAASACADLGYELMRPGTTTELTEVQEQVTAISASTATEWWVGIFRTDPAPAGAPLDYYFTNDATIPAPEASFRVSATASAISTQLGADISSPNTDRGVFVSDGTFDSDPNANYQAFYVCEVTPP
jgi:hypothetical protein